MHLNNTYFQSNSVCSLLLWCNSRLLGTDAQTTPSPSPTAPAVWLMHGLTYLAKFPTMTIRKSTQEVFERDEVANRFYDRDRFFASSARGLRSNSLSKEWGSCITHTHVTIRCKSIVSKRPKTNGGESVRAIRARWVLIYWTSKSPRCGAHNGYRGWYHINDTVMTTYIIFENKNLISCLREYARLRRGWREFVLWWKFW